MPRTSTRWIMAAALVAGTVTAGGAVADGTAATTTAVRGAPTVVAIVEPDKSGNEENGYNPYHQDFLASHHPWGSDIDLMADPATYIPGYPGSAPGTNPATSTPITLTMPADGNAPVDQLHAGDAAAWSQFQMSTPSSVTMHRFPGTKVIGALSFGGQFFADNEAHGTRSAASAVGNLHGTCPECLVVLINGTDGAAWARQQSWIDVVSNSWSSGSGAVDAGIQSGLGTPKNTVEAGQTMVFAAGNGMANGYDIPQLSYASGQRGPDWIVTVGATTKGWNYLGSGKPADISAAGTAYPSTGGVTVSGTGTHSGTSNAAPVVAGTFAKVIQLGRDLLHDTTGGYAGGVLAEGTAVTCGAAVADCPLGGLGQLTRSEVEKVVFSNVLPAPPVEDGGSPTPPLPPRPTLRPSNDNIPYPIIPTTGLAYFYVGHGVVAGHDAPAAMAAEQARFRNVLLGDVAPLARPAGERAWMVADSKCRERIWGAWDGGYYSGVEVDDGSSPLATAWDAWCTPEVAAQLRGAIRTVGR